MSTELALPGNKNRLEDSLFSKELAPHYMNLAIKLANSGLIPKDLRAKPNDLFIAMAMGYQIGLSVEQAIQAIAVINGRPCLWGDDMLALCMGHPEFDDIIEKPIHQGEQLIGYSCTVKRKGKSDHESIFTLDMAKKAGLLGKTGPWTQYTDRMLQLRARSYALRNRFPDALKGIKSREELEDYIDVEPKQTRAQELTVDYSKKIGLNPLAGIEVDVQFGTEIAPEYGVEIKDEVPVDKDINMTTKYLQVVDTLVEKGVPEDRIQKMYDYYGITQFDQLTDDQADHLLKLLEKS